ncbi:MAG: hypothetical protein IIC23_02825 [Chloroflexi bacterium]|nr:hypothetical protein [Chloroflexota bacterium]
MQIWKHRTNLFQGVEDGSSSESESAARNDRYQGCGKVLRGDYRRLQSPALRPLHFDKDFAGKTRLERLISQAAVTTGLPHALAATDMPGPGTVFLGQSWSFPKPVYSQCKSGTSSRRRQR